MEIQEIIVGNEERSKTRRSSTSTSSQKKKECQEVIEEIFKAQCIFWPNIILLPSFNTLCVAIGSVDAPETKRLLRIGEQICQGIFLSLLVIKLLSQQQQSKLWLAVDLLSVAATFLGIYIPNEEVGRCLQALRTLRIAFLIKEVEVLNQQMRILASSVKKASNVLVPALCLLYIYAAAGLYSFSGTSFAI